MSFLEFGILNFRILINKNSLREEVCYIGVVAWHKNLFKGSAVFVEGELQSKNWKMDSGVNRTVVEIKAKRIQFLNKQSKLGYIEKDCNGTLENRNGMADAPKLASFSSDG